MLICYFGLHSIAERNSLNAEWLTVRSWPFANRRLFPDLGLMQQPIGEVREYYGESIAMYFAWMEHYTNSLMVLALIAAVVELSPAGALGTPLYACVSALWCTLMAESWKRRQATLAHEWGMVGYENEERPRPEFIAAFHKGLWAADHEADPPEVDDGDGISESNASMRLDAESKPMVKMRQSSLTKIVRGNKGGMERRNGFYDRRGFVPHDDAPETLVMPEGSRLRVYLMSIPTLVLCTVLMLVVTLGILTFRMLMSLSRQLEEHPYFNPSTATTVGALLNTLWITVMNMVYAKLAAWLNDLENHRTDTEHEDALIVKTFLFQFANSYIVLFYIAFIQGLNFSLYGAFGYTNAAGQAYHDMCGLSGGESGADSWAFAGCKGPGGSAGVPPPTAGDPLDASNPQGHCERAIFVEDPDGCVGLLRTQLFYYTVFKPLYEVALQALIPWLQHRYNLYQLRRRVGRSSIAATGMATAEAANSGGKMAGCVDWMMGLVGAPPGTQSSTVSIDLSSEEQVALRFVELGQEIEEQMAMPAFDGTFSEYNTKVIQYGFVCMFASAFPPAAIAAAIANFVELRFDAHKIGYSHRRPVYRGAEDIGSWQHVMDVLSWLALVINALIVAYTSNSVRDMLVIPWLADRSDCSSDAAPSWDENCVSNWRECYLNIGGTPEYPAWQYLPTNITVSVPLLTALCEKKVAAEMQTLYDEEHCFVCQARQRAVSLSLVWTVFILEHVLVLVKLFLAALVPDVPRWVELEQAKQRYVSERQRKEQ